MNVQDQKIIFLDRDGVINKKPPKAQYVTTWREFVFLPGAIEGLQFLTKMGYDIFIITNQPGIARGMMTEKDLQEINEQFLERCKKEGVIIKKIYYCPHGWDEGCLCRKPQPGMLLQASKEFNFDITKTLFIGDDIRDKEAGDAAHCKTLLVEPDGNLLKILQSFLFRVSNKKPSH
ncbi:HAD family hydrolase [Candidatus Roizmanbacteria bacterium]|nr:HAD family hydrolase [Candidatus Roizmanbacteria bacterium]